MHSTPLRSFVLSCLVAAVLTSCGGEKGAQGGAPPPTEVGVVTVGKASVAIERDLVGRLSAWRSADVRARVAGVLRKRLYEEGADVTAGQPLFQIDPSSLQAAYDAAGANLMQARATYTNAHVAAERARSLAPGKFISKADLDNALAAERSAAAAVQQQQANVDAARINLDYATVRAPIAGRAGAQQVTEGALVGQGDATLLTTVEQIDPLYVNFAISAAQLQKLRDMQAGGDATLAGKGQARVRIKLPDGSYYAQDGTLDFAAAAVDPATGAVTLRARIPNPKHTLLPGLYVGVQASLGEMKDVFLVPQAALQRDAVGPYVLVVGKDGLVGKREVVAEGTHGSDWVISSGLQPGEQVIVSGIPKVQPGAPAKATPWSPPADPGAGKANPS